MLPGIVISFKLGNILKKQVSQVVMVSGIVRLVTCGKRSLSLQVRCSLSSVTWYSVPSGPVTVSGITTLMTSEPRLSIPGMAAV